jgi:NADH dehydrogenase/NADH:ubiquinone oxidoreductase subunit G
MKTNERQRLREQIAPALGAAATAQARLCAGPPPYDELHAAVARLDALEGAPPAQRARAAALVDELRAIRQQEVADWQAFRIAEHADAMQQAEALQQLLDKADSALRIADQTQAVLLAARAVERNLTRCFGRAVAGHDIPTTQAVIALRMALAALDADGASDDS